MMTDGEIVLTIADFVISVAFSIFANRHQCVLAQGLVSGSDGVSV
jgi:hypothetical protein